MDASKKEEEVEDVGDGAPSSSMISFSAKPSGSYIVDMEKLRRDNADAPLGVLTWCGSQVHLVFPLTCSV